MRAIVLAAGYGTRLYPLTLDQPKALLPVGPSGETVLDYTFAQLTAIAALERLVVVTNERFAAQFVAAVGERSWPFTVELLSDGTASPEARLGAVGDLVLALEQTGTDEPALVLGADNVFEVSFAALPAAFAEHQATTIGVLRESDPERLRRTGVVELGDKVLIRNQDGKIEQFIIVGSAEANPVEGKISDESPVGRALLGRKTGDKVEVKTPAGLFKLLIMEVS